MAARLSQRFAAQEEDARLRDRAEHPTEPVDKSRHISQEPRRKESVWQWGRVVVADRWLGQRRTQGVLGWRPRVSSEESTKETFARGADCVGRPNVANAVSSAHLVNVSRSPLWCANPARAPKFASEFAARKTADLPRKKNRRKDVVSANVSGNGSCFAARISQICRARRHTQICRGKNHGEFQICRGSGH